MNVPKEEYHNYYRSSYKSLQTLVEVKYSKLSKEFISIFENNKSEEIDSIISMVHLGFWVKLIFYLFLFFIFYWFF